MKQERLKTYSSPEVTKVELDSEISLQLASDPTPFGEPDHWLQSPENLSNDPLFEL
jgi:hypothetical protein